MKAFAALTRGITVAALASLVGSASALAESSRLCDSALRRLSSQPVVSRSFVPACHAPAIPYCA